ncbi:trihelix transcription factor GTL1-like [Phalaenopsis equestris]|uniref:trihelix transcription factor GTL1-like n=1 Tax=Phalaenopsis equestris TaxID=78828 RepID=UPI0009E2BDF9|nr:trihelix transcription factor GTL1-like [Phalaenopsis equestris]
MKQQGGSPSQYGQPPLEMVPQFSSAAGGLRQPRMMVGIHGGTDHPPHQQVAEAASPISSRSAQQPMVVGSRSPAPTFFDELGGGGGAATAGRSFVDEEGIGAGEDGERGGGVGSRWPRQETLALLKIRSEMDAAFRDATLKGPLWEDVSRKLAELGYTRSAKKCKEKFENVHKYYKRTKEGRAGRQDGKSYRFFTQLEALHSTTNTAVPSFSPATNINPFPPLTSNPSAPSGDLMALTAVDTAQPPPTTAHAGISFSSDTSSSSSSDSDAENNDYGGAGELPDGGRKRKREGWPYGNGKTIAFFEKLMKQLIERQEAMQQRFLDTIEKREQDRMAREEAWKRQEMARLNREYELMVQERTMTANRDAAVISFLQRFAGAGLTVTNQQDALIEATTFSAPAPPEVSQEDQPEGQRSHQVNEIVIHQASASSDPAASNAEMAPEVMGVSMPSPKSNSPPSRWPKTEVLALIKLRSGLEVRYLETGPKGPFWEDISMGMKRLGYNRSPKRCKEKWENINKYFKKVKEGNKKRPEDAKTCPYFHELDALYRRKQQ